ncbi:hypothetical protein 12VC501_gene0062 [Vibrio phage 12VC501]|nr:hypothetical protein 12VC501_gene0062 [Vibrio phage 12VC501]
MTLTKTKESEHVIDDWYFISTLFLNNNFYLWVDIFTHQAKGFTYDTPQDNSK